MHIQEQEERDFYVPSESEWDQAGAHERGAANPDQAWVLSSRDCWYPNPYYRGPAQPHPEDDYCFHGGDDRTPEEREEDRLAKLEDAASDGAPFDFDMPF